MSRCDTMEWSKLYLLGDEKVDSEHRKLFVLAEKIQTLQNESKDISAVIGELVRYTKFHFASEERYMNSIGYNKLAEHKLIHREIVESLQMFIDKLPTLTPEESYTKVSEFVQNGLIKHILIEDKKVQHFKRSTLGIRSYFTWSSEYLLGQKTIDSEHKELFRIALKALNYENVKNQKEHARATIMQLNKYMQEHFKHEEEYMLSIAYPSFQEHKKIHAQIIDQVSQLIQQLPKMKIQDFEKALVTYIDIWLVNHIIHEDHKITCFQTNQLAS